ncbi:HAD family acid phosphatase [Piscirickettsia salmonis]|uniref:HAD family acid phosphatase n=1 Tax=Piscirickettsia salmonis TaxID=1238 RepID=UPI0007C88A40|nr:HAD superfamily, subfamily IIIB (Acid phosphatase) [Piscirickettsiaceae bacterium NZ-RLO1]
MKTCVLALRLLLLKAALVLVIFFAVIQVQAAPLQNLDALKQEIIQYHESGEYEYDVRHIIDQAKYYLTKCIAANKASRHQKKLAIVLDIDETSLSNYSDLKKLGFGGTNLQQEQAEGRADDVAIASTLDLYQFAQAHHVAVFFITGRTEMYRSATMKNLKAAGYTVWQQLDLKPNDYNKPSVIDYKQSRRQAIAAQGYDIVLNIGDQYSDLAGGYADRTYKLPDYMYYIN